jgi:hypothetical protein
MKKALAILVLFSYMLCAFGVNISIHHCGGHFKYLTFKEKSTKKCCKKKVMPPGCCKDNKVKFKKNGNDFPGKQLVLGFKTVLSAGLPPCYDLPTNDVIAYTQVEERVRNNSPPDRYSPPLYILYEVFRI